MHALADVIRYLWGLFLPSAASPPRTAATHHLTRLCSFPLSLQVVPIDLAESMPPARASKADARAGGVHVQPKVVAEFQGMQPASVTVFLINDNSCYIVYTTRLLLGSEGVVRLDLRASSQPHQPLDVLYVHLIVRQVHVRLLRRLELLLQLAQRLHRDRALLRIEKRPQPVRILIVGHELGVLAILEDVQARTMRRRRARRRGTLVSSIRGRGLRPALRGTLRPVRRTAADASRVRQDRPRGARAPRHPEDRAHGLGLRRVRAGFASFDDGSLDPTITYLDVM